MGQPVILYDNRFDDATPTASTTAAGFAVANLTDWRPYTWWKPTAIPATVTVDCGAARAADYALICGHDLGSTGHRIQVRGSTDNFSASDVLVASQATDNDRPLLVPFTSAEYRYWRLRVAEANLLTYSEQFDDASWTKTNAIVNANAVASPDGTITGEKVIANSTSGVHLITKSLTPSSGAAYTLSAYAKAAEYGFFGLQITFGGINAFASFNLNTGAVHTSGGGAVATIIAAGNGWHRCSITATTISAALNAFNLRVEDDGDLGLFTGDGTSGIYIWGAQLEEASTAGPYVATGATTTSTAPSLAIASIGARLTLPTYLNQGFDPVGRSLEGASNLNANGQPLGRAYSYERWQQSIDLNAVPWSWMRDTFLPAWRSHLRSSPFGFCWEPDSYASEVRLVTAGDSWRAPHQAGLLADFSFDVSGVVE